jgi:hypothetical protein
MRYYQNRIKQSADTLKEKIKFKNSLYQSFKKIKALGEKNICKYRLFLLKKKITPIENQVAKINERIQEFQSLYQDSIEKEKLVISYKKDYIFSNILVNNFKRDGHYWLTCKKHQSPISLNIVLDEFTKGKNECVQFLIDNNIKESDDIKKTLGMI